VLRKYLVTAAVAVAALAAAAAAQALTAADSFLRTSATVRPSNSGTSGDPTNVVLGLRLDGGLKPGKTGQPETTDKIAISTPFRFGTDDWPRSQRCDSAAANRAKSNRGCPRKSRLGTGRADLKAGSPPLPTPVSRTLNLTVHVIRNGSIGIWAQSRAGESPQLAQFIPGRIRGGRITFDIPSNFETPLNVKSSIDLLRVSFGGSTTNRGERVYALSSTRCQRRRWPVTVTFDTFTGNLTDTDNVRCSS
jgi:hypothetical protein